MTITYLYLRCPICKRASPLLERIENGRRVRMDFGNGRIVERACRACILAGASPEPDMREMLAAAVAKEEAIDAIANL